MKKIITLLIFIFLLISCTDNNIENKKIVKNEDSKIKVLEEIELLDSKVMYFQNVRKNIHFKGKYKIKINDIQTVDFNQEYLFQLVISGKLNNGKNDIKIYVDSEKEINNLSEIFRTFEIKSTKIGKNHEGSFNESEWINIIDINKETSKLEKKDGLYIFNLTININDVIDKAFKKSEKIIVNEDEIKKLKEKTEKIVNILKLRNYEGLYEYTYFSNKENALITNTLISNSNSSLKKMLEGLFNKDKKGFKVTNIDFNNIEFKLKANGKIVQLLEKGKDEYTSGITVESDGGRMRFPLQFIKIDGEYIYYNVR